MKSFLLVVATTMFIWAGGNVEPVVTPVPLPVDKPNCPCDCKSKDIPSMYMADGTHS